MSLTVIITILTGGASLYAWNRPEIMHKWIFNPYTVSRRNEYQRFITSGFIHNDYVHLGFNLIVFYMFGHYVEYFFTTLFGVLTGSIAFIALYIGGIIVSDIPTYFKYRELPHYNSLGASGGVSSILFSYILFEPMTPLAPYAISILSLPAFIWAAIYMIYSYFMGKKGTDNINHDAHFYGAAFGIAFTVVLYPRVISIFLEQLSEFSLFSFLP